MCDNTQPISTPIKLLSLADLRMISMKADNTTQPILDSHFYSMHQTRVRDNLSRVLTAHRPHQTRVRDNLSRVLTAHRPHQTRV